MEHNKSFLKDGFVILGASRELKLALLLASIKPQIQGRHCFVPQFGSGLACRKELPILPCSSGRSAESRSVHGLTIPAGKMSRRHAPMYKNIEESLAQKEGGGKGRHQS